MKKKKDEMESLQNRIDEYDKNIKKLNLELIRLIKEREKVKREFDKNHTGIPAVKRSGKGRAPVFDGFTDIPNRQTFDLAIDTEWRRLYREKNPLSLLMLEIDYFDGFKDRASLAELDKCLTQFGALLFDIVNRPGDLSAKFDDSSYVILLPNTNHKGAENIARVIQKKIKEKKIENSASDISEHLTLSIGIATVEPGPNLHKEDILSCAAQALELAKDKGRNRYQISAPLTCQGPNSISS